MGEYSQAEWYIREKQKWLAEYGEIPPPWVFKPTGHPYQIGWRMGSGESFLMTYWEWWEEVSMEKAEMIQYFKRYHPPPRWLGWVCEVIWNLEFESESETNYTEYFKVLQAEGYLGTELYQKDFEDPQWLEH